MAKSALPPAGFIAVALLLSTSPFAARKAHAASFDCTRAKAADERSICADRGLSNLDSRLVGLLDLDEGTVAMGQRGDMQDQQTAWLAARARCDASRTCLRARYEARLKQVTDHLTQRLCGKDGPPC